MRTREEIESEKGGYYGQETQVCILEVLLDIRDLLTPQALETLNEQLKRATASQEGPLTSTKSPCCDLPDKRPGHECR